jgi:hypothetical protein
MMNLTLFGVSIRERWKINDPFLADSAFI